ncbi:MAG TPA: hypothetical protein VIM14_19200 [Polyangia bacterium]
MRSLRVVLVAGAVAPFLGCFHAVIDTGKPPSNVTIDQDWASGFIGGLVPPDKVETASKCPSGVSKVETQRSFLNSLVGIVTLGIYTPMQINVTCAAGGTSEAPSRTIDVKGASAEARQASLDSAAQIALETGQPVTVRF